MSAAGHGPRPAGGPWSKSRLGCSRGLPRGGPPLCPGRVLVRADHGAIDEVERPIEVAGRVLLLLDGGEEPVPNPRPLPPPEPAVHGGPGAIPLGQVAPGGSRLQLPEDAVENPP